MSVMELLGNVGMFGLAVMVCLAGLSIFSVGVILQKYLRFRSATRGTLTFKPAFGKFLRSGNLRCLRQNLADRWIQISFKPRQNTVPHSIARMLQISIARILSPPLPFSDEICL